MSLSSKLHTLIQIQKVFKSSPLIFSATIILCIFNYWLIVLKGRYDGIFIDTILRNSSHDKLKAIIFYIILYYIAYNVLQKFRDMLNQQFSQHMIIQIKKKITKPQTPEFLHLCNSSINLLITPLYDVIRIIITSYIMYSISQHLFLLILGLTPFKILGILSSQFFKKEESTQLPWKLSFTKGLLDKILQVIVIYETGARLIDKQLSIEDLVIFGSQLVTFDSLLPAVKTDFEGLRKALVVFERVFEEIEAVEQMEQEQIGNEVFEEKSIRNFSENIMNKKMRQMKQFFYKMMSQIKALRIWNLSLNLRLFMRYNEQVGRQEQGLSLNTGKCSNAQSKKRLSVLKSVKDKMESWVGKRRELMNEEGSPRKRERIMMNT